MKEEATFAMGCFWQPDLLFTKRNGVIEVQVGYIGGDEKKYPKPTYQQVCSDRTGYAEAVHITFDNKKVTYKELVELFFKSHNPTTLNRQGPDVGSQYRSEIFVYSEEQRKIAEKVKQAHQKMLEPRKIVTPITKASTFFPAEDYHQKYLQRRGLESCHI